VEGKKYSADSGCQFPVERGVRRRITVKFSRVKTFLMFNLATRVPKEVIHQCWLSHHHFSISPFECGRRKRKRKGQEEEQQQEHDGGGSDFIGDIGTAVSP